VNVTSPPPPTAPTAPTPLDDSGSRDAAIFGAAFLVLRLLIDEISFFVLIGSFACVISNVDVSIIELRRALFGAFSASGDDASELLSRDGTAGAPARMQSIAVACETHC
jgi:hypothetical protein